MGEDEKSSKRVCTACGHKVPPDEYVCSHCGNVFRKEVGEWDWKLVPKKGEPARCQTEEEVDRENDD